MCVSGCSRCGVCSDSSHGSGAIRSIVASCCVLAQASSTQLDGVAEMLSSVTTGSILIWSLWQSESRTRPRYLAAIAEARRDYLDALKDERESHAAELREIVEQINK